MGLAALIASCSDDDRNNDTDNQHLVSPSMAVSISNTDGKWKNLYQSDNIYNQRILCYSDRFLYLCQVCGTKGYVLQNHCY